MTSLGLKRTARLIMAVSLIIVSACSKTDDAPKPHPPGSAYLDSQIPSGLSPQYFPPQGFVWGGFKSGSLPEARYGVASPPVNPQAQVLILADAAFPAEAYFELAHDLIKARYTVWIFEAPGQGGSGRYFLQGDKIHSPDYNDATKAAQDFIATVIKPDAHKPIYIIGTGTGAVTTALIKLDPAIGGIIIHDPYAGLGANIPQNWRGDDMPVSYWGQIGHRWQKANPDLRLRAVSQTWQAQMDKAVKDLTATDLKTLGLMRHKTPLLVLEDRSDSPQTPLLAKSVCKQSQTCQIAIINQTKDLSQSVVIFIKATLTASKVRHGSQKS